MQESKTTLTIEDIRNLVKKLEELKKLPPPTLEQNFEMLKATGMVDKNVQFKDFLA